MEQSNKMTPKDFFLHLGVIATLYVSTVALVSFLFSTINIAFPETLDIWVVESARSSIAWALSVFIIVYPVFVYLLFKTSAYLRKNVDKAQLSIRKWFMYLTIFVTSVTLIVDGIVLLTTFLQGEQLTLRFLLKVLTIIVVAITIFWASLKDLKGSFVTDFVVLKRTLISVSVIVLVLIITGFMYIGSPYQARLALEDQQRVQDLGYIQNEIVAYWKSTKHLPENLELVNDPVRYVTIPADPATAAAYEYRVSSPTTFELCATFATEAQNSRSVKESYGVNPGLITETDAYFAHGVGRTCFTRTIDPERLK